MSVNTKEFDKLFDRLVPSSGSVGNVAGELVRAVARIGYRYMNDGDKIGVGYGRETCNPAARYILEYGSSGMSDEIGNMWSDDPYYETVSDEEYEDYLNNLVQKCVKFVNDNPDLENKKSPDMFSLRDPREDVDTPNPDEEEYYDEDDYDYYEEYEDNEEE